MNPLTKLDVLDIVPDVASYFYFDAASRAYLLVIGKQKWDALSNDIKRKFMMIARRIKEETEAGALTTHQRMMYETSDLFEMMSVSTPPANNGENAQQS